MANIAIFRINYKSDFILTLNSDAGWMTPFCIKFWTGAPSQAYFVGYDGTTYTHCAPVAGDPTKLEVQFDDHHLPIGDLKFQIGYHFTVADFPTTVEDEVINQAAVIIDQDGTPMQVMLDLNGETAPEIEFSLPAYANEAQRIANEEQRIAHEAIRIVNEESRIAAETIRQQNEAQRIAQETARVNEFATLKSQSQAATRDANDAATLANQKAQLAADKAALADDAATLANQKAQLAADKAALANDAAQLANEKAALAQQKAEYAQTQGGYAKDQGDYAKDQGDYAKAQGDIAQSDHERAETDHGIAVDDHTQAGNDHTRAESDHGIAADDHTRAGNDHTRAESDHGIAADDHTQAGNDHTRAESDHGIAADDHTQAGNDHTRAESDHTRAESDHAAVEPFVDSLGAFDISAYHATGGVLAKYADLTAALGTNGANIPDALRKGGMSVKFVQSSDNKYVRYNYLISSVVDADFANVANWQGVDEEPEFGSHNLVESGGVAEKLYVLDDISSTLSLSSTNINSSGSTYAAGSYTTVVYPVVSGKRYKVTVYGKTSGTTSAAGQSRAAFFASTPSTGSTGTLIMTCDDAADYKAKSSQYTAPSDGYIGISFYGGRGSYVGVEEVTNLKSEVEAIKGDYISKSQQTLTSEEKIRVRENLGFIEGKVGTNDIAEDAITADKLGCLEKTESTFSKDKILSSYLTKAGFDAINTLLDSGAISIPFELTKTGHYIENDGSVSDSTNWYQSNIVPVSEGQIIVFYAGSTSSNNKVIMAMTNENGTQFTPVVFGNNVLKKHTYKVEENGYIIIQANAFTGSYIINKDSSRLLNIEHSLDDKTDNDYLKKVFDIIECNIFDDFEWTVGYYITNNLVKEQSSNWVMSNKVFLHAGATIHFFAGATTTSNKILIALTDANETYYQAAVMGNNTLQERIYTLENDSYVILQSWKNLKGDAYAIYDSRRIQNIENKVNELDDAVESIIGDIPEYVIEEKTRIENILKPLVTEKDVTVIAFNTDQHIAADASGNTKNQYDACIRNIRAMADLAEKLPMDMIVLGGDEPTYLSLTALAGSQENIIKTINACIEAAQNTACPVVAIAGNHDCGQNINTSGAVDYGKYSINGFFEYNLKTKRNVEKKLFDNYGVKSTNAYFDIVGKKIRIVFVDTYSIDQTEYSTILTSALSESKILSENWKVIIFSHQKLPTAAIEIVETYYNQGVNIVCSIYGHVHYDNQYLENGILKICTQQAACHTSNQSFDGITYSTRTLGTPLETAFDVFVFNWTDNILYAVRYGNGMDRIFNIGQSKGIMLCNLSGTITKNGSVVAGTITASHHLTTYTCEIGNDGSYNFPYLCPTRTWNLKVELTDTTKYSEDYVAVEGNITKDIDIV